MAGTDSIVKTIVGVAAVAGAGYLIYRFVSPYILPGSRAKEEAKVAEVARDEKIQNIQAPYQEARAEGRQDFYSDAQSGVLDLLRGVGNLFKVPASNQGIADAEARRQAQAAVQAQQTVSRLNALAGQNRKVSVAIYSDPVATQLQLSSPLAGIPLAHVSGLSTGTIYGDLAQQVIQEQKANENAAKHSPITTQSKTTNVQPAAGSSPASVQSLKASVVQPSLGLKVGQTYKSGSGATVTVKSYTPAKPKSVSKMRK